MVLGTDYVWCLLEHDYYTMQGRTPPFGSTVFLFLFPTGPTTLSSILACVYMADGDRFGRGAVLIYRHISGHTLSAFQALRIHSKLPRDLWYRPRGVRSSAKQVSRAHTHTIITRNKLPHAPNQNHPKARKPTTTLNWPQTHEREKHKAERIM